MDTIAGFGRTGRQLLGSGSDLVEVGAKDGSRLTAIVFHPEYRAHNAINAALNVVRGFLESPMVSGLAELSAHDRTSAGFVYPTGVVWSTAEVIRTLADLGECAGVRAGVELLHQAGTILVEAAEAGEAQGVYSHGGLTPWRVMLDAQGQVQVLGYALPQVEILVFHESSERIPREDAFRYCPPERMEAKKENFTSDLFGLALIAFELMTGRPVYDGLINDIRTKAARGETSRRVQQFREQLPASVLSLLTTAMRPEFRDRFQSGSEFSGAVQTCMEDAAVTGASLRDVMQRVSRQLPRARQELDPASTAMLSAEELRQLAREDGERPAKKGVRESVSMPAPPKAAEPAPRVSVPSRPSATKAPVSPAEPAPKASEATPHPRAVAPPASESPPALAASRSVPRAERGKVLAEPEKLAPPAPIAAAAPEAIPVAAALASLPASGVPMGARRPPRFTSNKAEESPPPGEVTAAAVEPPASPQVSVPATHEVRRVPVVSADAEEATLGGATPTGATPGGATPGSSAAARGVPMGTARVPPSRRTLGDSGGHAAAPPVPAENVIETPSPAASMVAAILTNSSDQVRETRARIEEAMRASADPAPTERHGRSQAPPEVPPPPVVSAPLAPASAPAPAAVPPPPVVSAPAAGPLAPAAVVPYPEQPPRTSLPPPPPAPEDDGDDDTNPGAELAPALRRADPPPEPARPNYSPPSIVMPARPSPASPSSLPPPPMSARPKPALGAEQSPAPTRPSFDEKAPKPFPAAKPPSAEPVPVPAPVPAAKPPSAEPAPAAKPPSAEPVPVPAPVPAAKPPSAEPVPVPPAPAALENPPTPSGKSAPSAAAPPAPAKSPPPPEKLPRSFASPAASSPAASSPAARPAVPSAALRPPEAIRSRSRGELVAARLARAPGLRGTRRRLPSETTLAEAAHQLIGQVVPLRTTPDGRVLGWYRIGNDLGSLPVDMHFGELDDEENYVFHFIANETPWLRVAIDGSPPVRVQVATALPVASLIDALAVQFDLPEATWQLVLDDVILDPFHILADHAITPSSGLALRRAN